MTPDEAVVRVLADAEGPLHWTVIQDRALRAGYVDPSRHRTFADRSSVRFDG